MKTVIITDSTCDISPEELTKLDVMAVPVMVSFEDKTYRDGVDLTKDEFFSMLAESRENPTTSQPSPEDFLKIFEKHKAEGNEVVFIGLSSRLSGTVQSAYIAKGLCCYDKIYIVDSLSATAGIELLVRVACKMRDEGLSARQIHNNITELVPKVRIYAMVDTLKYLVRGGRLSKTAGVIGGALGMKPIITIAEGSLVSLGTVRGQKAGFEKMADILQSADIDTSLPMVLTYTPSKENLNNFEIYLQEKGLSYNWTGSRVGSAIGTHIGPGAIGMMYFVK